MNLLEMPVFQMMRQRMAWLTQRQQVLGQNVANSDTPGFKPSDLQQLDFARLARRAGRRMAVRTTSARHLTGSAPVTSFRVEKDKVLDETPAGNAVVLEEQLMKVAETAAQYQLTTGLYRKHVAMIRTAIGRAGR